MAGVMRCQPFSPKGRSPPEPPRASRRFTGTPAPPDGSRCGKLPASAELPYLDLLELAYRQNTEEMDKQVRAKPPQFLGALAQQ